MFMVKSKPQTISNSRIKAITLSAILLMVNTPQSFAQDLPAEQIRKSYNDSYQLESKERYLEAISALAPVAKNYPNTYTVNLRMGWLSYKNKSWTDAQKYYSKALQAAPNSVEAMNGLVSVEGAKQDWKSTEEVARRVLTVDAFNIIANDWLFIALNAQGNYAGAKKVALKMLTLYPTSILFLNRLGQSQYNLGDYATSGDTFWGVQILDPYNQTAAYYLNLLKTPKK